MDLSEFDFDGGSNGKINATSPSAFSLTESFPFHYVCKCIAGT
jgi:hypothetical protein